MLFKVKWTREDLVLEGLYKLFVLVCTGFFLFSCSCRCFEKWTDCSTLEEVPFGKKEGKQAIITALSAPNQPTISKFDTLAPTSHRMKPA